MKQQELQLRKSKEKVDLQARLQKEDSDAAVLDAALAKARQRFADLSKAKLLVETERESTRARLEELVTDVDLNWGEKPGQGPNWVPAREVKRHEPPK